jgi:dephospho-CoA kinase
LKKVAVTGGLASGKTTLCQFFKERSQYVLSADDIVHELLHPHTDLGKKIISLLGKDVVKNNTFDRSKIAQKVFHDENLLQRLEQLLHPEVQKVIEKRYQEISSQEKKSELFVVEVPLLFESGLDVFFDVIILLIADAPVSKKRFSGTGEEFDLRTKRFMKNDEKISKAHFVLMNNHKIEDLKNSFETMYKQLTRV